MKINKEKNKLRKKLSPKKKTSYKLILIILISYLYPFFDREL